MNDSRDKKEIFTSSLPPENLLKNTLDFDLYKNKRKKIKNKNCHGDKKKSRSEAQKKLNRARNKQIVFVRGAGIESTRFIQIHMDNERKPDENAVSTQDSARWQARRRLSRGDVTELSLRSDVDRLADSTVRSLALAHVIGQLFRVRVPCPSRPFLDGFLTSTRATRCAPRIAHSHSRNSVACVARSLSHFPQTISFAERWGRKGGVEWSQWRRECEATRANICHRA